MRALSRRSLFAAAASAAAGAALTRAAEACTRVLYQGADNTVITGRSMDWAEDMRTELWVFPAGMTRDGAGGQNTPRWTARYGSVIASGYNVGTADGMNERGLVVNLLYLVESDYGTPPAGRPLLSISTWGQFVLDNFATVAEAVAALQPEPFSVIAPMLPNGQRASLHLSISDASGDSAICEYIGGRLVIHHSRDYTVMTNSPNFDDQLALNRYWAGIGGTNFLPGTIRAADRFARAQFQLNAIPRQADPSYIASVPGQAYGNQALASVLGVVRSVGVPLGVSVPGQPNLSSTIWRTVADQKTLTYYFDSAVRPNTFWVRMASLNLRAGAPVMKLPMVDGQIYAGDVGDKLVQAQPFAFLPAS